MKAINIVTSSLEFVRAVFARGRAADLSKIRTLEERVRVLEAEIKSLKSPLNRKVSGLSPQTHSGRGDKEKS